MKPPEKKRTAAATAARFVLVVTLAAAAPLRAADAPARSARDGEALAREAATAWAGDARLIYLENDEPVTGAGEAARWGYLFFSPGLDASRAYSVQGGKIRLATGLPFDFDAPPLPGEWVDSDVALAAAEDRARDYRRKNRATIRSMFLVRGLLDPGDPDRPTWAVVYDAPEASSFWVVVDARSGKVVKTWRG